VALEGFNGGGAGGGGGGGGERLDELDLNALAGKWRLVYTTVSAWRGSLGRKRGVCV
jgi:hypothetical protein